jgi:hypothetical protein
VKLYAIWLALLKRGKGGHITLWWIDGLLSYILLQTYLLQGMLAIVPDPVHTSSDAAWDCLSKVCRERMDLDIEQAKHQDKIRASCRRPRLLTSFVQPACTHEAVATIYRVQMDQTACFRR